MLRIHQVVAALKLIVVILISVTAAACAQERTDTASLNEQPVETDQAEDSAESTKTTPDSNPKTEDTEPETEPQPEPEEDPRVIRSTDKDHPFRVRIKSPKFPKDAQWLNTSGPIRVSDLKGKFVLLDFWTYCCINCIHILPELKKLEHKYPKNLVVIGVHSAKFDTEKGSKNIEEAILRYEIEHPVVNDPEHEIWNSYGVSSWPSLVLLDPEGNFVGRNSGEFKAEDLEPMLDEAIAYYRKKKLLDESPLHFDQLAPRQKDTPLRFPGKLLADEATDRLYISDSNHNRIVVTTLAGKFVESIGSGAIGANDGSFEKATFDHPQGMALQGDTLYVADTENHLLRKVDLKKKTVATIAGIGEQGRYAWPGLIEASKTGDLPERWVGKPKETGLNSPWDLLIHKDDLYIAMAGPHQIWKMKLDETEIGPYAGNGREDIVDGLLLPKEPYEKAKINDEGEATPYSSFAQPSGLTTDGKWLYVADSEGSSIRKVPFESDQQAETLVGSADQPYGRLFEFGYVDGKREEARLQHALGVVYHNGVVYTADTYNNAIRAVDAKTGDVKTIAGLKWKDEKTGDVIGKPGFSDESRTFDEPAGISFAGSLLYVADTNNHAIRTVNPKTFEVATLKLTGVTPPKLEKSKRAPSFPGAAKKDVEEATVALVDGKLQLRVKLSFPEGWKINKLAPITWYAESAGDAETPFAAEDLKQATQIEKPESTFVIQLPAKSAGKAKLKLSLNYYYCQEGGEGVCKIGNLIFNVPIVVDEKSSNEFVELPHTVAP